MHRGPVACRATVPVDVGGSTIKVHADLAAVRVGRAVPGLTFGSDSVPFATEDIAKYVALASERRAEEF